MHNSFRTHNLPKFNNTIKLYTNHKEFNIIDTRNSNYTLLLRGIRDEWQLETVLTG